MSEASVVSPQCVAEITTMARARIDEAMRRGVAMSQACLVGHISTSCLLLGRTVAANVHLSGGAVIVDFCGRGEPSWTVSVDDGVVAVAGVTSKPAALRRAAELLTELRVMPHSRVLYGYVMRSQVVALYYAVAEYDEAGNLFARIETFVSEGNLLPRELHIPAHERCNVFGAAWADRVMKLIEAGTLVRMGDRLNSQPGEVWAMSNGDGHPWLRLDAVDNDQPRLARRYESWGVEVASLSERPLRRTAYIPSCVSRRGWFR